MDGFRFLAIVTGTLDKELSGKRRILITHSQALYILPALSMIMWPGCMVTKD